ncbi:hypothetical protein HEP73_01143 [Xanthomonas sp. GW]|uniref:hypothetical protein n=1 Tax=Xanthomonas sp. GW TaxID=2724121 RepID=UPI001862CF79|nr:hypothetical protein [Xanthomonas sp. GW]QNH20244.1 hypothetical protein HEP73_01143 [Xanthomonas sp. GW]
MCNERHDACGSGDTGFSCACRQKPSALPKRPLARVQFPPERRIGGIEAAKYGLRDSTFNGFGTADLIDGPPQRGCHLTHYRMAGDVVSAISPHIGEVVSLASQDDMQSLRVGRYLDAPVGAPQPNVLIAMRLGDHAMAASSTSTARAWQCLQLRRLQKLRRATRSIRSPSTISTAMPSTMRLIMAVAGHGLIGATGTASRAVAAWESWRNIAGASWRLDQTKGEVARD